MVNDILFNNYFGISLIIIVGLGCLYVYRKSSNDRLVIRMNLIVAAMGFLGLGIWLLVKKLLGLLS